MNIQKKTSLLLLAAAAAGQGVFAQSAPKPPAKPQNASDEELIELSPFEVSAAKDNGYAATETLAGTRIRTNLADVGSPISVITTQFLRDTGATDAGTLLQYTTNAEVAGTRGTYAGLGNGTSVDETGNLRAPGGVINRVRGLAAADSTRDFFVTDIPWDSYNVDRIDIQRGPNSILFGLGSPAGIVNYSMRTAEFRNLGSVEARTGSYGTVRTSLDINQVLIPKVLSIRLDGLFNDQNYQQKEAFQHDKRLYGSLRFDPDLFKNPTFHTSIKAKFEKGDIKANRPRIVPPSDSISMWFRPVDATSFSGGMGKLTINNGYEVGANTIAVSPWLTGFGDRQQPIWFMDGTTNQTYRIYSGYTNNGFVTNTGAYRGAGNSALGQRDSSPFYQIGSVQDYASAAKLPGYQFGQYRQQSLQDPSIFDFYHHLIDGPTASQFEKWNAYNIDLSQTGWDDRVGVQLTYDRQKYKRGGQTLINNPRIGIDILKNFQDLNANPNFGRPFVTSGAGNGSSYESDRKYARGSLFGELRAKDFINNDFWVKLLGKQRLNGVYSAEKFNTENRTWQMYANSQEWDAYWTQTNGASNGISGRPPESVIYLGPSVAGLSSISGANIPGITAPIQLQGGNVYNFNSSWKASGVNPADPWTVPANLLPIFDPTAATTQASNPANYTGWSYFQDNVIAYNNGQNPSLLTNAQLTARETKSLAGTWQGFFWNDSIVPTLGWRYDEVKGKAVAAGRVTGNRSILDLQPNNYRLPDTFPANQIFKDHSTAGGVVVHLNKLLGDRDPLPFNLSLSYNRSNNFQVTDTRRDFFGKPLANPTGTTKDYGILLSTKDGKYSVRIMKYKSAIAGASTPLDLTGLAGAINQGIKFRNVFLYQMSGYTWDTREQTATQPGQRYYWTPAYINSAGRPVADLNGTPSPVPAGAVLETQDQADAHRDASIRAWNDIQKTLAAQGFFTAWNFVPTTQSALTDRATYASTLTLVGSPDGKPIPASQYMPDPSTLAPYTLTTPSGLTVTSDNQSRGYEIEFTANPTSSWRVSFNAAKTTAVRTNVGGSDLAALVAYMDTQMAGVAGDMRQFNGNYVAGNEVRQNYANWRSQYTLLKLQEGSAASELRKWRFNLVTNYSFSHGYLKGVGVGGGYRWQDKVVIGYPVVPGANGQASFDLSKPYYGPAESAVDLWLGYERKLTEKISWRIQLNVYNVGKKNGLIPISVEPDGHTWAAARISPVQEWMLSNTFSF